MQRYQRGAVLPAIAAVLMMIMLLGALLLGIAYRITQRQRAKAALGEATRTIAQSWNYDQLAHGTPTWSDPEAMPIRGQALLTANLANIPGLQQSPEQAALKAQWTLLDNGGTCGKQNYTVAVICGSLELEVHSFPLGFLGTSTIHIESAVILDQTR